jgi:hypothetical protein
VALPEADSMSASMTGLKSSSRYWVISLRTRSAASGIPPGMISGAGSLLRHSSWIRFIPDSNTGEDACYFYNRLEGEQVRWVSYQFRGEPERILPDADVVKSLSSLTP